MAVVTNSLLLDLLNNLNIDASKFFDLKFDEICNEAELQPFLSWVVKSLDRGNIFSYEDTCLPATLRKLEESPELIEDNFYTKEVLNDVKLTKERKVLRNSRITISRLRSIEEEMRQTEREAITKSNKVRKKLSEILSMNEVELADFTIDQTSKFRMGHHFLLPEFQPFLTVSENAHENLKQCRRDRVDSLEIKWNSEESTQLPSSLENFERFLLQSSNEWVDSLMLFNSCSDCEVENDNCNALEIVKKRKSVSRQQEFCRRLDRSDYLQEVLTRHRNLLQKNLELSAAGKDFFFGLKFEIERLVQLTDSVMRSLCNDCDFFETGIILCENNGMKVLTYDESRKTTRRPREQQLQCLSIYREALRHLKLEFNFNNSSWRSIGLLLRNFRSGPTLRLCLVPHPLSTLRIDCRELQERLTIQVKQLAYLYGKVKVEVKDKSRNEQLLWIYFLTEPRLFPINMQKNNSFLSSMVEQ